MTARGSTRPTTARPKIGSSVWIVCPPTMAIPASLALSMAPAKDLAQDLGRQGPARKANQAERRQGVPGHGINVAQGIRRRDGTEVIRPVDDRREKIGRQDQGKVVAEPVNRCVVGRGMANEHVGVDDRRQARQEREQVIRWLLGRAAGPLGELGEAYRVEI